MIESRVKTIRIPKYGLLLILIWLCFNTPGVIGNPNQTQESLKETIYVQVFFAFPPGETMLVKNVILDLDMPKGPPVNTTLPAFGDSFIKTECKVIRQASECFISIDVYYDLSIGANVANAQADEVAKEFLKVLNYQNLPRIGKFYEIDETKNIIKIRQRFGYLSYSLKQLLPFVKYKPENGFGKFIDNLLTKHVPGTDKSGLIDLYYTLQKSESGFSWKFVIGGNIGKSLLDEKTEETIDLNELLNNSLPILASTHRSSIIIDVDKSQTRRIDGFLVTYTLTIKDISPGNYNMVDKEYYQQIKYEDLTTPLNNVIIKVEVGKTIPPHDYAWIAIAVGIIGAIAIAIVYLKKRKIRNANIKMER